MKKEYKSLSNYYDLIHSEKDYSNDVDYFDNLIKKYKKSFGNNLLDVACGTGNHIYYFKKRGYKIFGLDLSKNLIKIAKQKNKDVPFAIGNMKNFKLKKKFDVITCLFSSFAYLKNLDEIKKSLSNFYLHLNKGGLLIIETMFLEDKLKNIQNHVREYKGNNLLIKRTLNIFINGNLANVDAKYKVTKSGKQKNVSDKCKIKLFNSNEIIKIMEKAGFEVEFKPNIKNKTFLFLGVRN